MKSIDEAEAQARLNEILEEAQRQPIVIRRQGNDVAAIVSMTDYERLRLANIQSFLTFGRRSRGKQLRVDSQRVGVERIGRYMQAASESDAAGWESAAMLFGRPPGSMSIDPLFSIIFLPRRFPISRR